MKNIDVIRNSDFSENSSFSGYFILNWIYKIEYLITITIHEQEQVLSVYNIWLSVIFRGGASLETPGSVRPSVRLWELACEDDIYSASPERIRAFFH